MSVVQARSAGMRRLRFGHCVLDEGLGSLTAPDGAATVLRPKTFELLRFLLSQAGRVVRREEILDTIWPGIFVTDDSITQCVVEIRKAMGAGGAGLLRTIPRRGYLLQAEVMEDAPAAAAPALLSARPDDRPSIAVLPFRKDAADPQEAYFADGIIEGIVHVLSGLDGLFVVSRGSALAFAQHTLDARAAGVELGARYVLYGGVRRAGGRLRITTELTDAERGTILRADRYDGAEEDLFDLQDRIAEQVVAAVAPQLREHELARALRKPPASLSAYDFVLQALDQLRQLDAESLGGAWTLLRRAAEADPGYAPAHSYTAWVHVLRIAQGWSADAAADAAEAEQAALRAIRSDRNDGLAYAIQAYVVAYTRRDYEGGQHLLRRALEAAPNNALAWAFRSATHSWSGQGAEAVACGERALRLAPFDPFTFMYEHLLAQAHYTAGAYDQAVAWARRAAFANPRHAPNWRTLVASLVAAGLVEDAAEPARRLRAVEPGFSLAAFAARTPLQGVQRDDFVQRLRLAGLPD